MPCRKQVMRKSIFFLIIFGLKMLPRYNNLSDLDLIFLIKRDDHVAYRELFFRYTGVLYTHAYLKLQDREEARDAVQEIFLNLWTKRNGLEFQSNVSGYLYTALRNKVLNILTRNKVKSNYTGSLNTFRKNYVSETDHLARTNQLKAIVDREVQQMPEKMREIFSLSRNHQLTHREIAEKLGISENTVKNQVHSALKILRLKLGLLNYLFLIFF